MILQFLGNGIVNGSLIAITALGFSLVYNTTRVFHIAYAGIYVWAGYVLYVFMDYLHWPVITSFLMAILAAALLSVSCEAFLYAPLMRRGRSQNAIMISSVGMLILLVSLSELFFGNVARYPDFSLSGTFLDNKLFFSGIRLISLLVCMTMLGLFFLFLNYSKMGIRIRALRDDELLSRVFGIKTGRLKVFLFILSGVFVATASGLSGLDVGINPHLGIPVFINAFVALVIGGIGRFDGPVLGGLLLGIIQAMTEYFFDSRWVMMLTFILLLLFLLIRPKGLIPEKSRTF
ncbi:MAG: branched-chain amino acid ABC transporter permease [Bacteroidales bacterium]|nr:branched-chain amino acid ABC transporter permease [Bacteroidales bacterium]